MGLLFTTAAEGGIITSTTPAVVGLISFFFLNEKLSLRVAAGIALSVLGILALNVISSDIGTGRGSAPLVGNIFIFGAVIFEALFTIFGKATSERVTPLATAASASVL